MQFIFLHRFYNEQSGLKRRERLPYTMTEDAIGRCAVPLTGWAAGSEERTEKDINCETLLLYLFI